MVDAGTYSLDGPMAEGARDSQSLMHVPGSDAYRGTRKFMRCYMRLLLITDLMGLSVYSVLPLTFNFKMAT